MMTDPIADMLTRIRNAVRVERPYVDLAVSKVKRGVADGAIPRLRKVPQYSCGWNSNTVPVASK